MERRPGRQHIVDHRHMPPLDVLEAGGMHGKGMPNVRFALDKLLRAKQYAFVEIAGSALPVRVGP